MRKVICYKIIKGLTTEDIEMQVGHFLTEGWQPKGKLFKDFYLKTNAASPSKKEIKCYAQVMVCYE